MEVVYEVANRLRRVGFKVRVELSNDPDQVDHEVRVTDSVYVQVGSLEPYIVVVREMGNDTASVEDCQSISDAIGKVCSAVAKSAKEDRRGV